MPNEDNQSQYQDDSIRQSVAPGKRRSALALRKPPDPFREHRPWALIPYHQVRARVLGEPGFTRQIEWALTAIAFSPGLPFPIDPYLRQVFGQAFHSDPARVLRWQQTVRREEQRIKSAYQVRHYLLWHSRNIFDDSDPIFNDTAHTVRQVALKYAVAAPDPVIVTQERTFIQNTILRV